MQEVVSISCALRDEQHFLNKKNRGQTVLKGPVYTLEEIYFLDLSEKLKSAEMLTGRAGLLVANKDVPFNSYPGRVRKHTQPDKSIAAALCLIRDEKMCLPFWIEMQRN